MYKLEDWTKTPIGYYQVNIDHKTYWEQLQRLLPMLVDENDHIKYSDLIKTMDALEGKPKTGKIE